MESEATGLRLEHGLSILLLLLLLLVTHRYTFNLHIYNVRQKDFYRYGLTGVTNLSQIDFHEHDFYQAFFLHNRVNNLG